MRNKAVEARQLAVLYFAFFVGSAIINVPSSLTFLAKNGSSLALACTTPVAFILLALIVHLACRYPGLSYVEYGKIALGRWLGGLAGVALLVYVTVMLAYIVIGIGNFFTSTMMKETPAYVFHFLILLLIAMTIRAGIKAMIGLFTIYVLLLVLAVVIVLLLIFPFYHPEFLLPLIPSEGWRPIFQGMYFLYGFPFSEVVLFAMLFPLVKPEDRRVLGRWMALSLSFSVLTLLISLLCTVMVMGPIAPEITYSLYQVARLISVENVIERIEAIISFALIAGSYMKATIALYIGSLAYSQLLKLRDVKMSAPPLAFISFLLTLVMFRNGTEFEEKVLTVWPFMNITCMLAPLLLIWIVGFWRRKGQAA